MDSLFKKKMRIKFSSSDIEKELNVERIMFEIAEMERKRKKDFLESVILFLIDCFNEAVLYPIINFFSECSRFCFAPSDENEIDE